MQAFKGFDKDLKCRGFQYEIGKEYTHEGTPKACHDGFHACTHPIDVFNYYPPASSRFALVKQSGKLSEASDRVASEKIKIVNEISLQDLIAAAIKHIFSNLKKEKDGDQSDASNTGDYSGASNTGYCSAASNTGYRSAASNTGYCSAASNTGYCSAASNTGYYGVAMSCGFEGRAMASATSAIVLVNRADDGSIRHIRASKVGENGVKAGIWYTLSNKGEFVEVEN